MATLTTRLSVDINNKEYERLKHLAQKHGLTIKVHIARIGKAL